MSASFQHFAIGSLRYESAWNLRKRVLLDPFGIDHDLAQSDDSVAMHMGLFEGDDCVACLMLIPRGQGVVQMRQVAVATHLHRKSLGRALTTRAEEFAQTSGYEKLIAHARDAALPFYFALGYVPEGSPFEEVGILHQKVAKSLQEPAE